MELKEFTKEYCIKVNKDIQWNTLDDNELIKFAVLQLYQKRLFMPFDLFHKYIEKALKRPIWTHEFAKPNLLKLELNGKIPMPTLEDLINQIPEEKRLILKI